MSTINWFKYSNNDMDELKCSKENNDGLMSLLQQVKTRWNIT